MSAAPKRKSGTVVPQAATRLQRLGARVVQGVILGAAATCRFPTRDPHDAISVARREPVIFAIWHNRLAFSLIVHRRLFKSGSGGRALAALVSASRDGAFLASILEAFGVQPVRGSSSRRGAQALVEMRSWAEQGLHLALTPDGPRGPRYRVQSGVVGLAWVLGRPILPVAVNSTRHWKARSWDQFQVPLPFATCEIVIGEPVRVEGGFDEDGMEAARSELERRLLGISRD